MLDVEVGIFRRANGPRYRCTHLCSSNVPRVLTTGHRELFEPLVHDMWNRGNQLNPWRESIVGREWKTLLDLHWLHIP